MLTAVTPPEFLELIEQIRGAVLCALPGCQGLPGLGPVPGSVIAQGFPVPVGQQQEAAYASAC